MKLPEVKTKGTLADRTYIALKNAIIDLELKPGQPITEEEISKKLGVSRTPIRTALGHLQHDGLIKVIPGKGTFVTEITEKQVEDLLSIRELLESLAVKLAAKKRTEEDLEALRYIIYRQEDTFRGRFKNKKAFLDIDTEFHGFIGKISRNEYLENQLASVMINIRRFLNATTVDAFFEDVINEHKKIYEYIEMQDESTAEEYMKKHVNKVKIRMLESLIGTESSI